MALGTVIVQENVPKLVPMYCFPPKCRVYDAFYALESTKIMPTLVSMTIYALAMLPPEP